MATGDNNVNVISKKGEGGEDMSDLTYKEIIFASAKLDVHESYTFIKARNGHTYLKLKLKERGIEAPRLNQLLNMVESKVGTNRTFSHNPIKCTATFTLYNSAKHPKRI